MFYAHLLLNKRGPLAKIWLAAHWEKKLTKAHVYECNLETTIQSIISPKVTIALRTSGHLLLGVVRIYHRKAKYLLADCNEAFMKMKMAFRPGTVDLSEDNQEATYNAITLPEEFHEFDIHLPDLNTIDVVDHFSLNQSRVEDITLREEFGRNLILHGDFGDDLETVRRENPYDGSLEMNTEQTSTALPEEERQVFTLDCFGDEGLAVDMFEDKLIIDDTLSINEDNVNMSKEMILPPEASSEGLESAVQEEAVASHPAGDESTLLYDEEEGFVLEPVEITAAVEKKRHKRRRNLLVDSEKELSSDCLRQQLIDFTDTLTTVDIAPPTHKLMNWKSKGGVDWLLSNPAEPIISAELLVVFTHCLVFHTQELGIIQQVIPEIETIRHEQEAFDLPMIEDPSFLQESRLTDAGSSLADDPMQIHSQTLTDKPLQAIADLSGAPTPQKESPCTGENTASGVSAQDNEERRCSQRIQEVLNSLRTLNLSGLSAFSLLKLCNNKDRRQASAMFYSFLVLKKHSAINLSQARPYCDIMATPGLTFHSM